MSPTVPASDNHLKLPDKAKILIVSEDGSRAENLKITFLDAGLASECVHSLTAGCEAARSGRFQLVVSAPLLRDGSWRRLIDIASHYALGFEVIPWTPDGEFLHWTEALDEGAFDVLDATCERPKVVEIARRALWAAYLKGAGPAARTAPLQAA